MKMTLAAANNSHSFRVTIRMRFTKRRRLLAFAVFAMLLPIGLLARPVVHLLRTSWNDPEVRPATPDGFVDDASCLNATKVVELWQLPPESGDVEEQLITLVQRAKAEGRKISIAGARHTMGGHTIYPGGIVINMLPLRGMKLNTEKNLLTVQAGAIWQDVIAYLDRQGRSVAIMQSNNSFSIDGSLGANCHGWQYNRPPIASTVESFRLLLANGSVVRCSRTENTELFSLVLGGYGLFGVMLDVDLRVVPNQRYHLTQYIVPLSEAMETFTTQLQGRPDVQLLYARMDTAPSHLFRDVIINAFTPQPGEIPQLTAPGMAPLRRAIFRGSADSAYGKELRYSAELKLQPLLRGESFSRNQLLNESVTVFENRTADTTDILHEYFMPIDRAEPFVMAMREVIERRQPNLLNVTVRIVNEDHDSFLRYADQTVMAFVMLFVQPKTPAGEASMETVTRELIDAALARGGRYYLPYRLHATQEQFEKAYPQASDFFRLKLKYDPDELFQNQFYLKYGKVNRND